MIFNIQIFNEILNKILNEIYHLYDCNKYCFQVINDVANITINQINLIQKQFFYKTLPKYPDRHIFQLSLSIFYHTSMMKIKVKFQVLALLLCVIKLRNLILNFRQHKKIWKLFASLQQYTPTQLQNNLVKGVQNAQYAICKGTLLAGQQCRSILNPKLSIIYSELYLKKKMQVKQAVHQMSQFIRRKRPSFLKVIDDKSMVQIFQTSTTKHKTTHYIQKSFKNNLRHKALKKLAIIKNIVDFFSNHQMPKFADECLFQTYIPQGVQGIVFGRFKKGLDDKVCCQNPFLVGVNKQHVTNIIKNDLKWLGFKKIILILAIFIISGFILKKAYTKYLQIKKKEETDDIFKYHLLKVKSRMCSTCKQDLSAIINQPCGHFNQCSKCSKITQQCVQCSKKRKKFIEVYAC